MKNFEERKQAVLARAEEQLKKQTEVRRRVMTTASSLIVVAILVVSLGQLPLGKHEEGLPPLTSPSDGAVIQGPSADGTPEDGDETLRTEDEGAVNGTSSPKDTAVGDVEQEGGKENLYAPVSTPQAPSTTAAQTTPASTSQTPSTTTAQTIPETTSPTEETVPVDVPAPESTFEVNLGGVDSLTMPSDADHVLRIGGCGTLVSDLVDRFGEPSDGSLPVLCLSNKDALKVLTDALLSSGGCYVLDAPFGGTASYTEVTANYDEAFFEDYDLIVVGFTASSGSYRFALQELGLTQDRLHLVIAQSETSGAVTCDMADWLLFLAMPKEATESVGLFTAVIG